MSEVGIGLTQALQQRHRSVHVLNVGGMHQNVQNEPVWIGNDVALATLDTLEGIKASWPTDLRCRHTLAIDHTGRWSGAAGLLPPVLLY